VVWQKGSPVPLACDAVTVKIAGPPVTGPRPHAGSTGIVTLKALGDAEALSVSPPSSEEQAALDELATFPCDRNGLLRGAGDTPRDDRLCPLGFTHRPGRLDARPRHRRLLQDRPCFCRREAVGQSHPGHNVLDNITLYWLTGTSASAARSYWEEGQETARAAGQAPTPVSIPVGFTTVPGEIWRTPRSWVEKAYPNVIYFNEVDKGGHFAAWEEPELFATEIRAAFRPLR
jgi:pimeloyl-ACP methyl ester carboxylesterase